MPILSLVIGLPVLGILLAALVPPAWKNAAKYITVGVLGGQGMLLFWLLVYRGTSVGLAGSWGPLYGAERWPWMELFLGASKQIRIHYFLGIDSLSVGLVLLAWSLLLLGLVVSWSIQQRVKAYWMLYLLLNSAIMGSLLALDGLLFFIFLELTLVPVYFFVGIWGDDQGPAVATTFFLYAFVGSILVLLLGLGLPLSMAWKQSYNYSLGKQSGVFYERMDGIACLDGIPSKEIAPIYTFDLVKGPEGYISVLDGSVRQERAQQPMVWGFVGLLIAFLLKMGVVPVHSWLPATHVVVPTGISIVLAGIVLKLGAYGLLRMGYAVFPYEALQMGKWVGALGIFSSMYASLNVLATKDFKRMVAYSSISHMGFVLLGIGSMTATGIMGGVYQLISHGLISSLLFVLVAIYARRKGDRVIDGYLGLSGPMPYYAAVCSMAFSAAMGLPGSSTFIAELWVLLGAWSSSIYGSMYGIGLMVGLALFLQAVYCVWVLQRLVGGNAGSLFQPNRPVFDLTIQEKLLVGVLLVAILGLGIFPGWLLSMVQQGSLTFLTRIANTVGGIPIG
jgi:NADH-quinone oxidoreductase subunit M